MAAVGLALAATLMTVGLVEGALRLGGWRVGLRSEWILTNPQMVLDPAVIVMRRDLLPGVVGVPAAPPVVLTLGDSFTEGFPVPPKDAYPSVLGRVLAQRGVAVTVRNAAMGDSGPDQQLRLLEDRVLPQLRPDIVIWQFYANDVSDNVVKATYRVDGDRLEPIDVTHHWLALRQHLFDWTPLSAVVKKESRAFRLLLYAFEPRARPGVRHEELEERLEAASIAKLALEIRAFERLAHTHGFIPYLMLVPPQAVYLRGREPLFDDDPILAAHARLTALLDGRPRVIDGFLGLANAERSFDARRDPAVRGRRHLNERGYARLAALVARRLVHDGVLVRDGVRTRRSSPNDQFGPDT